MFVFNSIYKDLFVNLLVKEDRGRVKVLGRSLTMDSCLTGEMLMAGIYYPSDILIMENPILNEHNKQEYPPMHTAEHLLNGEMARRYGFGRAFSAHIERKKSKLDYRLPEAMTDEELRSLEEYVNRIIDEDVDVTDEYISQAEAMARFDMSRLPEGASDTVRVVHVGDYDECLCAGSHVKHTGEIGRFRITSSRYAEGVQRIVFKLDQ